MMIQNRGRVRFRPESENERSAIREGLRSGLFAEDDEGWYYTARHGMPYTDADLRHQYHKFVKSGILTFEQWRSNFPEMTGEEFTAVLADA